MSRDTNDRMCKFRTMILKILRMINDCDIKD